MAMSHADGPCKFNSAYFEGVKCPLKHVTYRGMQVVAGTAGPGEISLEDLPNGEHVMVNGVQLRVDTAALTGRAGRNSLVVDPGDARSVFHGRTPEEIEVITNQLVAAAGDYKPGSKYRDKIAGQYLSQDGRSAEDLVERPELLSTSSYRDWSAAHPDEHTTVSNKLISEVLAGRRGDGNGPRRDRARAAVVALAEGTDVSDGFLQRLSVIPRNADEQRIRAVLPDELLASRVLKQLGAESGHNERAEADTRLLLDLVVDRDVPVSNRLLYPQRDTTRYNAELLSDIRSTYAASGMSDEELRTQFTSGGPDVGVAIVMARRHPAEVAEEVRRQVPAASTAHAMAICTNDRDLLRALVAEAGNRSAIRRMENHPKDIATLEQRLRKDGVAYGPELRALGHLQPARAVRMMGDDLPEDERNRVVELRYRADSIVEYYWGQTSREHSTKVVRAALSEEVPRDVARALLESCRGDLSPAVAGEVEERLSRAQYGGTKVSWEPPAIV